jgi:glycosyltransferase involved in cell wall biosynthesis
VARAAVATVVFDNGRAKGDALSCGARAACGDLLVFIDADGSREPADLLELLAPLVNDEADLVLASRMRGGSDELHPDMLEAVRLIGSTIITQAINLRFGARLTDYQNGFRAVRAEVFRDLGLTADITTIEQEMAIKALRLG